MLVLQSVLTALLSGLFSGAIIFALNERRDRSALILRKTEEAIEAYQEWVEVISAWPLSHFDMFIGNREENRAKTRAIWDKARQSQQRATLLMAIYLPEKRNVIGKVVASYYPFIQASARIGQASISNEIFPEADKLAVTPTGAAIVEAGAKGLEELYEAARAHSASPFLVSMPWPVRRPKQLPMD
jgi:hypothetical protein